MPREQQAQIRELEWDGSRPVIFVHGDVDGMLAACFFVRSRGDQALIRFTGARRLAGDLKALAERIGDGLEVQEILIGNVPVRPASIGAVRQLVALDVPMLWVDHHATRQALLEELDGIEGITLLHDAEVEGPPCQLAARICELDDPVVTRLLEVVGGAESEDEWVHDRHTLLSAFIGRGDPDTLRRLALQEDLDDADREVIATHRARESVADTFVGEGDHPVHEIGDHKMVLLDARELDVGYLPRRVEERYTEVDLRVIVPDEATILVTAAEKGRDLFRLLRSLPWPSGTYVGGRPHLARISPGPEGLDAALDILCDAKNWPANLEAPGPRPGRDPQRGPRRGGSSSPATRSFFSRVVEQRVVSDLMEVALAADQTLEVFRGDAGAEPVSFVLVSGGTTRNMALYCTRVNADIRSIPVPGSVARQRGGCAVWARAELDAEEGYLDVVYGWFGRDPGHKPPNVDSRKGDMGQVNSDRFQRLSSPEALAERLFGWR